ncbi:Carbohydrate sulfotransferase 15 [Mactra antiquata]
MHGKLLSSVTGVKKSGTSDLYSRISGHPDILQNHRFKESQWIPRCRFNDTFRVKPCNSLTYVELAKKVDIRSLGYYTGLYAPSASAIRKAAHVGPGGNPNFGKIFGDATPANFHMHINWSELPGNEGLTEPKYTNFNYISHLTPDVKLIVIFRDPVSRLLSDFKYGRVATIEANPEKYIRKFHNQCVEMIKMYKECFSLYSQRQCIYMSNTNNTNSQMRLKFTAGFYSFFMKEMYALFNKKNILPILMTDYTNDMKNTLAKVFDFLELGQPNEEQWENILKQTIQNKSRAKSVRMWNETELLLKEFYKPLNEDLAELLNDSRFLFKN